MNITDDQDRLNEVRYSYGNLPPSVGDANIRLDKLDVSIATIEGDLRVKTERDLGTPDAYDSWKIRASRALAHFNREKSFIKQWLSFEGGSPERNPEILSDVERRDRLHMMVNEFLRSAPKFGVTPDLSKDLTNVEVTARRNELTELKMEYDAFLTFLKSEAFRLNCPQDYYYSAKGRVARIVQKAESESFRLKKLLKVLSKDGGYDCKLSYDPDPQPNDNPNLAIIKTNLHKIKLEIGMNNPRMVAWMHELITEQRERIVLDPKQLKMLELMGEYVRLTKEREKIEFPS